MTPAPVHVAGERLLLDPSGALFWPREGVLALAEPPPGRALAAMLRRWRPRRVLVLSEIAAESCPPLIFRNCPGHNCPAEAARGEIAAHLRPVAVPPGTPDAAALPCFVADAARVLLPGFGAGGQDIHAPVIRALFPHGARVFVLGRERFSSFPIGPRRAGRPP